LTAVWPDVRRAVGPMLASDLDKAKSVAIFAPNQLVIHFPRGYNQAYSNCADPNRQVRIQEAIRRATGEAWSVRVELEADSSSADGPPAASVAVPTTDVPREMPLIAGLIAALDGRVLRTDDGFGRLPEVPEGDGPASDDWTRPDEEE
jgi:hypothetical protein